MSALALDPMNDAAKWAALEPDGVTQSVALAIHDDPVVAAYGTDAVSARITATELAQGHLLRRSFGPFDVSSFSELRLSLRGDRTTNGSGERFFLELRLGSATIPVGDPANTWHRLLPLTTRERWETVKIGIDDLSPAIAGAVSHVQLRCIDAEPPFAVNLDDLTAVRPAMVADADRALEGMLAGITIAGGTVAATVRAASEPKPAGPALDLAQVDMRYAPDRARDGFEPRDYTADGGQRLVAIGSPYDLYYSVTAIGPKRGDETALVEAVLARTEPFDTLQVHGDELTLDAVRFRARDRVGGVIGAEPVLFFKIGTRKVGVPLPRRVSQVREIAFDAGFQES
jgi:hypothetical protein